MTVEMRAAVLIALTLCVGYAVAQQSRVFASQGCLEQVPQPVGGNGNCKWWRHQLLPSAALLMAPLAYTRCIAYRLPAERAPFDTSADLMTALQSALQRRASPCLRAMSFCAWSSHSLNCTEATCCCS